MNPFVSNLQYLLLIFGLISYTSPVYAYLDPVTGNILLQGLVGGIAAIVSFLSIYWYKVKAFFGKKKDLNEEIIDQD